MSVRVTIKVELNQSDGKMILEKSIESGKDNPLYSAQETEELIARCTEILVERVTAVHGDIRKTTGFCTGCGHVDVDCHCDTKESYSSFVRRDRGL